MPFPFTYPQTYPEELWEFQRVFVESLLEGENVSAGFLRIGLFWLLLLRLIIISVMRIAAASRIA